jgi:hypothetical protein
LTQPSPSQSPRSRSVSPLALRALPKGCAQHRSVRSLRAHATLAWPCSLAPDLIRSRAASFCADDPTGEARPQRALCVRARLPRAGLEWHSVFSLRRLARGWRG